MDLSDDPRVVLSESDRQQLTFWKWEYSLRGGAFGQVRFSRTEARRLIFLRVLCHGGLYADDTTPAAVTGGT